MNIDKTNALDVRIVVSTIINCLCGYRATSYWDYYIHKSKHAQLICEQNTDMLPHMQRALLEKKHMRVRYSATAHNGLYKGCELIAFLLRE